MMSRESSAGPPPFWLWKLARASGIAARAGASDRSICVLVFFRSFLNTSETWPEPTLTRSKVRSTFGSRATMRAISSATNSLCLSVEPGGRVKLTSDSLALIAG